MNSQQRSIKNFFSPIPKNKIPVVNEDEELTAEELERIERNRREAEEKRKRSMQNKIPFGASTNNAFNAFNKRKREENGSTPIAQDMNVVQRALASPSPKRVRLEDVDDNEESVLKSPATPSPRASLNSNKSNKSANNTPTNARHQTLSAASNQQQRKQRMKSRKEKDSEDRYPWLRDEEIRDKYGRKPIDPEYDPSTLYIPASALSEMKPFERQYWEIKKDHWDTVVFFKKGKFYELYEKDAYLGKELFDLKMTERVNMSMVGVPESSFKHWAAKFIAAGYTLGRVEQMETPEEMKKRNMGKKHSKNSTSKVVERELVEMITPGTLRDNDMIMDYNSPYLLSIRENQMNGSFGVAFSDVSTGRVFLTYIAQDDANYDRLETLLQQIQPRELLFKKGSLSKQTLHIIKQKLSVAPKMTSLSSNKYYDMQRTLQNIEEKGYFAGNGWPDVLEKYRENELVMCAFGGLLYHLEEVKLASDVLSMNNFRNYEPNEHASTMIIDGQTLANLEILSNNRDHTRKGSLIEHLDRCLTSFGKRLFRKWVCAPLRRIEDINARLDAIEDLHDVSEAKDEIRPLLKQIPDLERMLAKIHSESRIEKDAVSFDSKADKKKIDLFLETIAGLKKINEIANKMAELSDQFKTKRMKAFVQIVPRDDDLYTDGAFPQIEDLLEHFNNAFDHSIAREQGIICPNVGEDEEYDQVEAAITKLENEFQEYLKTVRQNLKCPSIEYKNLQGNLFQLEIPKNVKVPSDYIAMSKTTKVNRYYTQWISKNLSKYQELESKREDVLRRQMKKIFKKFDVFFKVWTRCIDYCAELDCLFSLSLTSFESHLTMTRPNFTNDGPVFDIKMMVHPCVTSPNPSTPIRPNDTLLGGLNHPKCVIVTGPNMGGKSTLLRQNCIAIIMAQIGCYVPAQQFTLSPVDRIFTRIGANDKIMAGESTFMVELNETSNIINNATRDSFVILDEMGRGTSTFDGLSIAYAVVQYLAEKVQCRTLFSTHYYNLTEQLKYHPLLAMYQMECFVNPADKNDITFLYKYTPGVCPKSYGMHVARMAGIDSKIVDRASQIAETFEKNLENQMKGTNLDSSNISVEQTQRFLKLHTLLNSQTDTNSTKAHLRMLQSAALSSFCSYI